jgi:hypothetical protein
MLGFEDNPDPVALLVTARLVTKTALFDMAPAPWI